MQKKHVRCLSEEEGYRGTFLINPYSGGGLFRQHKMMQKAAK